MNRQFQVECQINASNEFCTVTVSAQDCIEACNEAQRQIRSQIGVDPSVRGCIIVGWIEN